MDGQLIKTIEAITLLAGLAGIAWTVFRSRTITSVVENQKELIAALQSRLDLMQGENAELNSKHVENEKAIAELQGQIKVYKELPLQDIASSLKALESLPIKFKEASDNNTSRVLNAIQHVSVQTVDKQVVSGKV